MHKQTLIHAIRQLSYQTGEFKLKSGKISDYYLDLRNTLLDPLGLQSATHLLSEEISKISGVQFVGGIELGAVPITAALVYHTNLRGFIIRKEAKEHGTRRLIEGPITAGQKAILIEDVTTTGQSAIRGVRLLEESQIQVVKVITIVDRQEGGLQAIRQLVPAQAILTIKDIKG